MNTGMRIIRSLLMAALIACMAPPVHAEDGNASSPAGDAILPVGVVLTPADDSVKARAEARLRELLADRTPGTWAEAFAATATPPPGRATFMLGTFSSQDLDEKPGFELERTLFGTGHVSLTPDVPLRYRLIGANTMAQREYVASEFLHTLPAGAPDEIRKPDFEELALIWYFIGWDLDEPLLVARWGDRRIAFDFDDAGRLTWIERLSRPCFAFVTEEGKSLLGCRCMSIARDGARWEARFAPSAPPLSCSK